MKDINSERGAPSCSNHHDLKHSTSAHPSWSEISKVHPYPDTLSSCIPIIVTNREEWNAVERAAFGTKRYLLTAYSSLKYSKFSFPNSLTGMHDFPYVSPLFADIFL